MQESVSGSKTIDGVTWRVALDGTVTRREGRSWVHVPRSSLLAYPADCELWTWLREHGVRRPSPSGPRVPDARTERGSRPVRLDDETVADADKLAAKWGCSRPAAIARAVRYAISAGSAVGK